MTGTHPEPGRQQVLRQKEQVLVQALGPWPEMLGKSLLTCLWTSGFVFYVFSVFSLTLRPS